MSKIKLKLNSIKKVFFKPWPTFDQWSNWSLPSKMGYIGTCIAFLSIIFSMIISILDQNTPKSKSYRYYISGNIYQGTSPLSGAIISVVGKKGEYKSDEYGLFQFYVANELTQDSINLIIMYAADFQTLFLDTMLAKHKLAGLKFYFETRTEYIIAGKIGESGTGKPINNAKIILKNRQKKGITDSLGHFRFSIRGERYEKIMAIITHKDFESKEVGLILSEENQILLRRIQ